MYKTSRFFSIFLFTIAITRVFLYFNPTPSPTIHGFRTHHYMYGLVLAPIGIAAGSVVLFAIGVGLFVDELGYLLIGGQTHADNYSASSLLLLCIFIILIYLNRNKISKILERRRLF